MRAIRKISMVALVATTILLGGCNRGATPQVIAPGMVVTYATLDGCWELVGWNGEALNEGTFCYIEFDRTEQRFEMWSNFASMYGDERSGLFSIEENEYGDYILSGIYDYGVGDWGDSYTVVMYTPGDEMRWEAEKSGDSYTYCRIEAIPEMK